MEQATRVRRVYHKLGRLTDEQRKLADDYLPLLKKMASIRIKRWPSLKERIWDTLVISLMEAARKHDPSRGKFCTYLYFRVQHDLSDMFRDIAKEPKHRRAVQCSRQFSHWIDRETLRDPMVSVIDPHWRELPDWEDADALEELIKGLKSKEKTVIRLVYRDGLNQTEAAQRMGYSQSEITRLIRTAFTHLRGTLDYAAARTG